jgi:Zn-dependent M28 family amino/carboxypeptidase
MIGHLKAGYGWLAWLSLAGVGALAAPAAEKPLPDRLKAHVVALTSTPKARTYANPASMDVAADYLSRQFRQLGLTVSEQKFKIGKTTYRNIQGRLAGGQGKLAVVGAHYDVCGDQPGADDNASGVAGLIELAKLLAADKARLKSPVEFVAYALEEPPFFRTPDMGSHHHAETLAKNKVDIDFMLCLESIGYFSDAQESQRYPVEAMKFLYPSTGNFIAVVGNANSGDLVKQIFQHLKEDGKIASQMLVAPAELTGLDFSDHLNYWKFGYRAVMVTDTAFLRNPAYHAPGDRPETLDYSAMAKVVQGLAPLFLSPAAPSRR